MKSSLLALSVMMLLAACSSTVTQTASTVAPKTVWDKQYGGVDRVMTKIYSVCVNKLHRVFNSLNLKIR